ncbi:MAG: hypothetical protein JJV92_11005 [Desulfosarcina sp.]|nr:hypothetical protein [Desulfobacterales bacterium]
MNQDLKERVNKHWENETCGIRYKADDDIEGIIQGTEDVRYELEPEILEFVQFQKYKDKKVLEIGVGGG